MDHTHPCLAPCLAPCRAPCREYYSEEVEASFRLLSVVPDSVGAYWDESADGYSLMFQFEGSHGTFFADSALQWPVVGEAQLVEAGGLRFPGGVAVPAGDDWHACHSAWLPYGSEEYAAFARGVGFDFALPELRATSLAAGLFLVLRGRANFGASRG